MHVGILKPHACVHGWSGVHLGDGEWTVEGMVDPMENRYYREALSWRLPRLWSENGRPVPELRANTSKFFTMGTQQKDTDLLSNPANEVTHQAHSLEGASGASCKEGSAVLDAPQSGMATGKSDVGSLLKKSDPINREKVGSVPRFLVVGRTDGGNFEQVNPFIIFKTLNGIVGELRNIKKIKEGLLLETVSPAQARRLMEMKQFIQYEVEVKPHGRLNLCKGIIFCRDLLNCTDEEIRQELSKQDVIEVKRIQRKDGNNIISTGKFILTFNKVKLPNKIRAAYYSLSVEPHIPPPMRCFNCQKFGHISHKCPNSSRCACGSPSHEGQNCQEPLHCVNCEGNHSARSRKCPKFIEEMSIQKIKTLEKVTYSEAKRIVSRNRQPKLSYAQAATTSKTAETKNLSQELIPQLSKLIEEQVRKVIMETLSRERDIVAMPPPSQRQATTSNYSAGEGSIISDASTQLSNKQRRLRMRKELEEDEFGSDDSQSSSQTNERVYKRKKGWPRGKPRKPPALSSTQVK